MREENNNPNPDAVRAAINTPNGIMKNERTDGIKPKIKVTVKSNKKLIRKSTNPVTIADKGKIIFGKYTFLMIFSFSSKLLLACVKEFEKKFQKTNPHNTNNGYGKVVEDTAKNLLKRKVKRNIAVSGWKITHKTPRSVCL